VRGHRRRRQFFRGSNTQNQLRLILSQLGTPRPEELELISNEKCRKFIESLPKSRPQLFESLFEDASPKAIGLLKELVQFAPNSRCTVEESLTHPYLEALSCPSDEPMREPLDSALFEFERRKVTMESLRDELYAEMLTYYPELMDQFYAVHAKRDITSYRLLDVGEAVHSDDEEEA